MGAAPDHSPSRHTIRKVVQATALKVQMPKASTRQSLTENGTLLSTAGNKANIKGHSDGKPGTCSASGTVCAVIFEAALHGAVRFGLIPKVVITGQNFWVPAVVGAIGFVANVIYAAQARGRSLNWPMAISAIPFVFPGMAMWLSGFPSVGVSIASIAWTSPPTDALQPFTHGDRNAFAFAFDMVVVAANFLGCAIAGVYYTICAWHKFSNSVPAVVGFVVWSIFLWCLPLCVWVYNRRAEDANQKSASPIADAWEKGHIVWHTVASLTCCLGCLSGAYVCDQL
eukprot:COSAG01_NODE_6687_length_3542_cov_3.271856_3_plen_284_part_00